jgi:hypothetical protein
VLIPEGNPLHGKNYDDIDVDVHGGLTLSQLVDEELIETWGVKHGLPLSKEDIGSWMVGWDTAHFGDTLKKWPKEAVQEETNRLMNQLQQAEKTTNK